MKNIITVMVCWSVICTAAFTCQGQSIDSASQMAASASQTGASSGSKAASSSQLAASYFKEAEVASQNQRIWKEKMYGPMLFVDPQTRVTYANMPDSAGILKPDGSVYKGILPTDVIIANTSIHWQGKMWSVIQWPLPLDHDDRLSLVMHESFHRIQDQLGLPQRSPTIDHLGGMTGRIYFLLELQALKAALNKPVNERGADLTNALIFRAKRQELFPNTFPNERLLEMHEGLAEYTGQIIGRQKEGIRQYLYHLIDSFGEGKSLIRAAAYITGPVYGYLLYQKSPGWTAQVDSNSGFPALISTWYHLKLPQHQESGTLAILEKQYNGDVIIRSEKLKEEKRLQSVNEFTELFTRATVLTIELIKMNIGFNPSILFDLGEYGVVYPIAEVKDTWGQLNVAAPGMLMKDWKTITLPAESININGQTIEGKGWKLVLNEHWAIVKVDSLHFRLKQQN